MPKKNPGFSATKIRPCALCYAALGENEAYIHDKHRNTEIGKRFLAQLDKPKLRPEAVAVAKARKREKRSELLTELEQQVVRLLADGNSRKRIAVLLGISPEVVSSRLYRAKKQAGASTLYQLVVWYKKMLDIEEEDCGKDRRGRKAGNHEDRTAGTSKSSKATAA